MLFPLLRFQVVGLCTEIEGFAFYSLIAFQDGQKKTTPMMFSETQPKIQNKIFVGSLNIHLISKQGNFTDVYEESVHFHPKD